MSRTDEPRVRTSTGAVRGLQRSGSAAFLGIPYARAPVGPLRFLPPVPFEPWEGVRAATRPGPTPQRRPLAPVTTIPEPSVPGEEILNLNVFTPAPGEPRRRLPVLVWIHGGAFVAGSAASPWYDGASFNRHGVVSVTLSYRLGFDGFGWIEDAPLNRGVLDQIAALEWVRENIAAFGGDPDAVTVAGQSAGGSSVMTLLSAPRAQHLFRSVISHSAAGLTQRAADAERIGRQMADAAGVPPTREGWSSFTEEEVLDVQTPFVLRHMPGPVDPVAFARQQLFPLEDALSFGPVVDGDLIPRPIELALSEGVGADKGLLAGATAHESTMALHGSRAALAEVDAVAVLAQAGLPIDAAADYPRAHPELSEPALQLGQLVTDRLFRLPLVRWADARARSSGTNTWLYDFRWRSPVNALAAHCFELPFAWGLLSADGVAASLGEDPPQQLGDAMHGAWVQFVRDGDPGWATSAEGRGMLFDRNSREGSVYEVERRLAQALAAAGAATGR